MRSVSLARLLFTAGIITEVTLKVHKIPAHSSSVRVSFDSIDAAAKTVQDTLAVRCKFFVPSGAASRERSGILFSRVARQEEEWG